MKRYFVVLIALLLYATRSWAIVCGPVTTFPFKESFDGLIFPPACWANVNTIGPSPGTWNPEVSGSNPTCSPHSGYAMARFNSYNYLAPTTGCLITPALSIPSDQYEVHFWMYRDNGFQGNHDSVNVYYNTVPGTAGATRLGTVCRYFGRSPVVATANQWYEYVFYMPPGSSGDAYIIFEGVSQFGNNIFLDDITVKPVLSCPYYADDELEPCGSDLNGGCNMAIPAFEPISLGETKCGTVWSNSLYRDTDWYIFTLAHRTQVTLEGNGETPLSIGITLSPCPAGSFITSTNSAAFVPASVSATLDAGTYYAFISPSTWIDNSCGNENKYVAALTGTSCFVETFPFKESFDETTFPPPCWLNQNTSGSGLPGTWDWQTAGNHPDCTPHSGLGMARFNSFNYSVGTTANLVTSQLALPSDQYEVHFWLFRDAAYPGYADRVNVYYNTTQNTAGAVLLGTVYRDYLLPPAESTPGLWYEYIFSMPTGSSGPAYIIFEGVSGYGNNIFIDDVKVKEIFYCPPVSTAENEPCGLDLNGGCNMTVPAFEPIALGETKCGTSWCDGSNRDTDWYIFTLTETTDLTLSVQAEFPSLIGFVSSPCAMADFISYIYGSPGDHLTLTKTLPAGTYYVFIAPQDWSTIITCGGESRYRAKIELTTPAGSTAELEPCGADLNGGCNMSTPAFEPIAMGETISGTAWCDGGTRDTDWYIFTLTEKTRVTLTAKAEFPLMIGLANSPCPVSDFINYQYGDAGATTTITSTLNSGTYYAWIGPSAFGTIVLCEGADKYWAKLTGTTCFEPSDVKASLVTATTATISWTAPSPGPGSGYQYEIRTSGAPGSGAAGLAASGSTPAGVLNAAVSGLAPGTAYFAYVRSNCGGASFSLWSAPASFTTSTIAVNLTIPSVVVSSGQSFCYNALQTITVGGNPPNFVVFSGGSATMIAGLNIHYFPGVLVLSGGYLHGYIAPGGPFCVTPPLVKAATVADNEDPAVTERSFFKVYPNPTTGKFTLEQKGEQVYKNISVEVYGMRGDKILASGMGSERKLELSLSNMPVGLYFVKVIADDRVETFKLIKSGF